MPKKDTKTRAETSAESFFPIDEDDLKRTTSKIEKKEVISIKKTTEKLYRGPVDNPIEEIKKTRISGIKRKPRLKKFIKKTKLSSEESYSKNIKEFKTPNIKLKKDGYELVITEKPQAAMKIADALGNSIKRNLNGIPYYEVNRNNKKIVVACAVGHLFTLNQKTRSSTVPVFDISWEPNYISRKKDFTKKYFDVILKLAKEAGEITVATDYDVEGEVIGLNIVRSLCGQKDANRMKFSTLTTVELNNAYEKKSNTLNWGQAIAGETRHYLDWFYGINLSRAIMNAIKTTGKFRIMSIGRVQGPALNLIVKKEREIQKFVSTPYWEAFITVKNSAVAELKYTKEISDKKDLEKFAGLKGKTADCETTKEDQKMEPGVPFNLTALQIEAYKFYGISPSRTLQIAQFLYLGGLISYPRTSSQKLPDSIDYKSILKALSKKYGVEHLIVKTKPLEGKKSDPAHPSIYPTGQNQILSGEEEKIYELIVRRFLSLFCEDAIVEKKKITAHVDNMKFATIGTQIKKKAWMEIYPSKLKENKIPEINGSAKIINVKTEEKETQPPKRYSQASIISELEKKNLGTKATRASILETLYDRGYVQDKNVTATPLGISLINTLEKYSPVIIDEKLTRNFEKSMESIIEEKENFKEKEDKIIDKAKKTITDISKDFEKNGKEIGKELIKANDELREKLMEDNKLIICPLCNEGSLHITYSKKTRRYFIGCNSYPKCKNTYSLPPNGIIKKTSKNCEDCNFPILMRLSKGKKPWEFCFNPNCPKNKERIEKYRVENAKSTQDS